MDAYIASQLKRYGIESFEDKGNWMLLSKNTGRLCSIDELKNFNNIYNMLYISEHTEKEITIYGPEGQSKDIVLGVAPNLANEHAVHAIHDLATGNILWKTLNWAMKEEPERRVYNGRYITTKGNEFEGIVVEPLDLSDIEAYIKDPPDGLIRYNVERKKIGDYIQLFFQRIIPKTADEAIRGITARFKEMGY